MTDEFCQNTTEFVSNQTLFCIDEMWHDCERHPCTMVNITRRSSKNSIILHRIKEQLYRNTCYLLAEQTVPPPNTHHWLSQCCDSLSLRLKFHLVLVMQKWQPWETKSLFTDREDFVKWFIVCFFHQMCLMVGWKH